MSRLTEADLAAIQARERAATRGPWTVQSEVAVPNARGQEVFPNGMALTNRWIVTSWIHPQSRAQYPITSVGYSPFSVNACASHIDPANAEFMASARQDVPALLAEVRRLRAALADIRDSNCQDSETEICWCTDKAEKALEDSERF